jgi:hypothetical protein
MFLTKGEMPHEALWEAWIREAEGLVPAISLTDANCGESPVGHLGFGFARAYYGTYYISRQSTRTVSSESPSTVRLWSPHSLSGAHVQH